MPSGVITMITMMIDCDQGWAWLMHDVTLKFSFDTLRSYARGSLDGHRGFRLTVTLFCILVATTIFKI